MSAVNAKAIRYIDCPTCGAERRFSCITLGKNPGPYSGTWFVHWARKEPFMTEFWRGVRYQADIELRNSEKRLL